ncbi:MAG: amidohydrolase family protein [Aminobacterium colombiense]|jgi:predicted TIM-barrel fold metal-dependent hydrolase|uniref:Amidohydrolase 2 n=1 Tax=Aminobacterium colombiense (strain DSM 12261 / ALA-1) TaxID=572547 RepID=D5ED32_AMICL|nr:MULTISPECIES: amidohydrolase family protein [Aminobacterium]MDD2378798.1 amidohydrolase family protein [Aminobacterium colombiense]ADE56464.1 amidohydrolase 2 [Aminobacterium colombiense DSM 12261]MDD4266448.1 amidohydrolase family protein [Aminobacterium colombiense]MDD4585339.1 amidohydrolase family protein [Aminobacterium colombiense]NLK30622.1 amidohydrolase family protein [Aminobacterium colombiense]
MIIDTHVHVYPPDVIRDFEKISEREGYFKLLCHGKIHKWATYEDVIEQMDKDGIEKSWIFGFAFKDLGLCRHCNNYVIEAVKKHPNRFQGLAVVPPLSLGADEEIARCAEEGLIGVGELFPGGQGFDIDDVRQTWRLVGTTQEAGMVLLFHTAEPVGHDYPGKGNVGPREGAQFCMNHPEAKVVFAHFGGGLWLYELMPEMKRYLRNARYDTAALPWLYTPHILQAMKSADVLEKLFYGSDFPILSFGRYERAIKGVLEMGKDISDLLGHNVEKFLVPRG